MQYLISVIDDASSAASDDERAKTNEMAAVDVFNDKLRAEGHWVYANGLHAPETATTIDNRGADTIMTDGPFLESKEYLAGFWIIEANDLDAAIAIATEGSKACNRKVEVRAFH
jgi:hypothetical protein